ncbi:MAG: 50S ribosomal protein L4 [Candidatus Woesebacteria bacterium GW2011_GWB1_38_5b]|uniref:Large ribosomal subunit protein uL4 n=2 Tax=Candidatus Woeseibacteriota TaxID=1752722 RepID=A0A0G0K4V5_9BACT|nr:MAG: 50S ribosomal protein L4 [Candidatus Woesebacteria bacterium GW2011_GWB1_38_5b]OGM19151.1 MAG: 50S ribosomal protein L4 [Candidatus Woesebacteria bacterium RIFCSPHIGHO2_01_FULL_38_10]OGM58920.1 MAG: 50S ribosomal protein L4 [Candidatus Woesebacteria bacterium RIFCSPLOWO2_01_FULL_39_10b]
MTKLNAYTLKGVKTKSVEFPKDWQGKENMVLLAQAIRVYEWQRHPGLSKVKTRAGVSRSGRKIYRQKGTGLARHGDKGAPIFVGGGVAHGPKGVKKKLSLPKKIKRKALKIALTLKAKKGELIVVDNISTLNKTKDAVSLIKKIAEKEKNFNSRAKFTFILLGESKDAQLALRNIANLRTLFFENLNVYDVFYGGILVMDKGVFYKLSGEKIGKKRVIKSGKKAERAKTAEINLFEKEKK